MLSQNYQQTLQGFTVSNVALCECCGMEYTRRVFWQRFCSKQCQQAVYYFEHRDQILAKSRQKRVECPKMRKNNFQRKTNALETLSTHFTHEIADLKKLIGDLVAQNQALVKQLAQAQTTQRSMPATQPAAMKTAPVIAEPETTQELTEEQARARAEKIKNRKW